MFNYYRYSVNKRRKMENEPYYRTYHNTFKEALEEYKTQLIEEYVELCKDKPLIKVYIDKEIKN